MEFIDDAFQAWCDKNKFYKYRFKYKKILENSCYRLDCS